MSNKKQHGNKETRKKPLLMSNEKRAAKRAKREAKRTLVPS